MHKVIHLFERSIPTAPAMERQQAMSTRKAEEFVRAAQDCEVVIGALEVIPHGHYARITDAGVVKVVAIFSNKVQLVNGTVTVSKFTETDSMLPRMRCLTAAHVPEDLGDYQTFMRANEAIWRLALKSSHRPPAGLAFVQAVDHLARSVTPLDEGTIDAALAQFAKRPSVDAAAVTASLREVHK